MLRKLLRLFNLVIHNNTHEYSFNVPVKISNGELYSINERVLEIPIIHRYLSTLPFGKRILDFGCTRSWLSITLSAMGYHVIGVDLRNYEYRHPNFEFYQDKLQNLEITPVDCVVAISTLEHVGIGAYNDKADNFALTEVLNKIHSILSPDGWLLLTVPVGKQAQDNFQRTFSPTELTNILTQHKFSIENIEFFSRSNEILWHHVRENELKEGNYSSGVSSVACIKCVKA